MKCSKCNHIYDDTLTACPLCGEPAPETDAQNTESQASAAYGNAGAAEPQGAFGYGRGPESGTKTAYSAPAGQTDYNGAYQGRDTAYQSSTVPYPPAAASNEPVAENAGVAPMVLGILGVLLPFVGIILGIIAIVMGNNQRKAYRPGTAHYGFGQAGWVLGIVAVVIQALTIIYFVTVFSLIFSFVTDMVQSGMNGYPGSGYYPYFDF